MAKNHGTGTRATIDRIRELLAIPDEIGPQDDSSPAVNKASFAQEAALRKRDAQVFRLARELIATRDAAAARFLLDQVRVRPTRWVAGELALALVGVTRWAQFITIGRKLDPDDAALPEVLRDLAELFLAHKPPAKWTEGTTYLNPLLALDHFWTAGVAAVLHIDRDRAAHRLEAMIAPSAIGTLGTRERFSKIVRVLRYFDPPGDLMARVVITLSALARARKLDSRWTFGVTPYFLAKGREAELAGLLEADLDPGVIQRFFQLASDPKVRKRVLPAIAAVAAALVGDGDPAALARVKVADEALGMKGALVAARPGKPAAKPQAPKPPPRVKFASTVGTDGGPILALPTAAATGWRGVLRADGSVPDDGDFAGTDYQRACDVDGVGFIKVGKRDALVLGEQGCSVVLPKEGGCLLVLAGEPEDVFAAIAAPGAKPEWRALKVKLALAGELLLFDAAMERAKTRNRKAVELPAGRYRVEHVGDRDRSPWVVRLTLA